MKSILNATEIKEIKDTKLKTIVLTVSGEPRAGKSSVIKELTYLYEEMGFNVEIISVGDMYGEKAKELGIDINQLNECTAFMKRRDKTKGGFVSLYYKICEEISKNPMSSFYHTGFKITDFENILKKVPYIDEEVDNKIKEYGKQILENTNLETVYIFDSRLAWQGIPSSFSIRYSLDEDITGEIAGKRAFKDSENKNKGKYKNVEEATIATRKRKENEIKKYKAIYGIDLSDPENYSVVIDTSHSSVRDIAQITIECEYCHRNKLPYKKKWNTFDITEYIKESENLQKIEKNQQEIMDQEIWEDEK